MGAGEYRNKIEFQQQGTTTDASGTRKSGSWSAVGSVWAKTINSGAQEVIEGSQTVGQRVTLFRCRQISFDVDHKMRILHRGNYYYVTAIEEHNAPGLLDVKAEFRDNQ